MKRFGAFILRNLLNLRGWQTSKRILVIESDDWGSIRVPSKTDFDSFIEKGFPVEGTQYNRLDALESNEDMLRLLEVLGRYKDNRGMPPCLTVNMIMANPDFQRIRASDFQLYRYEHFKDTLARYPQHDKVFELLLEGRRHKLLHPQFHGREHLNIKRWMSDLRSARPEVRYTFDLQTTYSGRGDYNYMEALDMDDRSDIPALKSILSDGLNLFEKTFGFRSRSFIAPCYTWDSEIESVLYAHGVEFIQGSGRQYVPRGGFGNYRSSRHILGERNDLGQVYLTRNCFFEPALVNKSDWVDYTMSSIRDAFRWNKPAIVCAHRINFIGYIDQSNRERNLRLFDDLLRRVLRAWPDVEFMTSDRLGELIRKDHFL